MAKVVNEVYIEGLGQIVCCDDSAFDKASGAVLKKSDGLISLRDLAYARIFDVENSGRWNSVNVDGSYVQEGSLYDPKGKDKRIMLRKSLILPNPSIAVKAHDDESEYILAGFNVEKYLGNLKEGVDYVIVKNFSIPTEGFEDYDETRWAFGNVAKEYGTLLKKLGINNMSIRMNDYSNDSYIDNRSGPFADQIWLQGQSNNSFIIGNKMSLSSTGRVRGLRRESQVKDGTSKNLEKMVVLDSFNSDEFCGG